MTDHAAAVLVRTSVTVEIVALGWTPQSGEDIRLIEQDANHYVGTAHSFGLSSGEILEDVLTRYRAFFGPSGDVDVMRRGDMTAFVFYVRMRRGRCGACAVCRGDCSRRPKTIQGAHAA